ncbi:hypothetical protein FQN60_011378 [Etheostoma spectabile]|uniref:Uncharacterized protein n=1 Tax=Etheostoma spectabile TaxID=54343 RepID=A0A5J5DRL5_9PERO|nr:hypothetical protein FQN60_011378 [Etheostoma spectabile]
MAAERQGCSGFTTPPDNPKSPERGHLSGTPRTKEGLLESPHGVMGPNVCTGTDCEPETAPLLAQMGRGCATETRRRLITSSSFAVGWLHLDGPVHLEREVKGEREKEEKGNPRSPFATHDQCATGLDSQPHPAPACSFWKLLRATKQRSCETACESDCDNEFSERVCCNVCSSFLPNYGVLLDAKLLCNKEPVAVAETVKPPSKSRYKDDQTLTFD